MSLFFSVSPVTRGAGDQAPRARVSVRDTKQEERVGVMERRRPPEPTGTQREDGDDWCLLFQSIVQESRKMLTGTLLYNFIISL